MRIKIKIVPPLSHLAGRKDDFIEISEGANVRDALSLLVMKYDKKFEEYVLNPETREVYGYIQVIRPLVAVDQKGRACGICL